MPAKYLSFIFFITVLALSCKQSAKETLFTSLPFSQTGIHFNNDIDVEFEGFGNWKGFPGIRS